MSSFDPGELLSSFGRGYSSEHQIFLPTDTIYFIVNDQNKQQLLLCVKSWEQRLSEYLSYLIVQPRDDIWPLNYQLTHVLDNLDSMRVLAPETYPLHMRLSKDAEKTRHSQNVDIIDSLLWKSSVNIYFLEEMLSLLRWSGQHRYPNEIQVIEQVCRAYRGLFIQHSTKKHVKHCHEVLKATDLWTQATSDMISGQLSRVTQFLKPGGIDFLPASYSTNTLSNPAVSTTSIETHSSINCGNGVANLSPVPDGTIFTDKDARHAEEEHIYEIERIIESASAFVCITYTQGDTRQRMALKILREYKDERYHYGSPEERLTCQKEALRKNAQITSGVYRGLARILRSTLQELEEKSRAGKLQSITLGTILHKDDEIDHINAQGSEYALAMSYLSDEHRLDLLLQEKGFKKQKELFLHRLATRIEEMHRNFLVLTNEKDEDGNAWGSYEQLLKKLQHNFIHFDLIEQHNLTLYEECSKLVKYLKIDLQYFIEHQQLRYAFNERQQCNHVKQCHGDLKTNNIWIETINRENDFLQYVHILDAVDFNEPYRNIDVLADLAMLVVDVEAIGDENLGKYLKEEYLSLSEQTNDDAARLVLTYYLLEKAIVCAIVCIVYDHREPLRGKKFLKLAEKHAKELREMIHPN